MEQTEEAWRGQTTRREVVTLTATHATSARRCTTTLTHIHHCLYSSTDLPPRYDESALKLAAIFFTS